MGLRIHAQGGALEVEVHDDGPGVPPGDRDRIFRPFERVDGLPGRTGLGLWIVRRIAECHGGEVGVTDSDLGGACFRLSLPCA